MFLCELLHKPHIVVALIVGALAEFAFHAVDSLFQARGVAEGLACLLFHRGVVGNPHHLRQIAYAGVVGNTHHATCGLLLTTQNLQQRRLAGAVLANECDAVTVVDYEACLAEQRLHAKLNFQVFNRYHRDLRFTKCKSTKKRAN